MKNNNCLANRRFACVSKDICTAVKLGVKDFFTIKGYILALIVILGLPGLSAYRVYLRGNKKS